MPLFHSSLPRTLVKLYRELEIECPIQLRVETVRKEKKEKAAQEVKIAPLLKTSSLFQRKAPQTPKKRGDIAKVRVGGTTSRLPLLDFTTIKHRITKHSRKWFVCAQTVHSFIIAK